MNNKHKSRLASTRSSPRCKNSASVIKPLDLKNDHKSVVSNNRLSAKTNRCKSSSTERRPIEGGQDNDANSIPAMSNLSSYSLIDDDHIDDQETINVGNLIIDLESDLEKEKIENEHAHSAKPTSSAPTPTSSTTSTFGPNTAMASSSSSINNSSTINSSATSTGKSGQKLSKNSASVGLAASTNNNCGLINNNNTLNSSTSNGSNGRASSRTLFKSSSDERGESLKMRITRENKPGKSEHKIVTSPNQKSPTSSCSIGNNAATSPANEFDEANSHDSSARPSQSSSISSTKECGTSTSIGTITEPDCLGPCEPGTSVTLEGIVWQETDGGILVVNVTWRGKTYVGALLDCTRHDWAPPRLCDSPASDIDSKIHKGVRPKRIVTRSNGIGLDEKNLLQTTGKLRNGKGRRILNTNDLASCNKRQRESDKPSENPTAAQTDANISSITNSETACVPMNIDTTPAQANESISTSTTLNDKAGPNSPMLIGCSEPNCSKKYRNMNGLLYHQAHAHGTDNEQSNTSDNICQLPSKDKPKSTGKQETSDDQKDVKEEDSRTSPPPALETIDPKEEIKPFQDTGTRTPSPQLATKITSKITNDAPIGTNQPIHNREAKPVTSAFKNTDLDRRPSLNNSNMTNQEQHIRSPVSQRPVIDYGTSLSGNLSKPGTSSSSSLGPKINNPPPPPPPPLPITSEEGMKPSGTSTGPPPAPHQQNYYFNSAYLAANHLANPYSNLNPYLPKPPMYDQILPPTSAANAAFMSRYMNIRVPSPSEPPSRLLSPSMPKNLSGIPPFRFDTGPLPPVSGPPMMNPNALRNLSPMTNPPLTSGSPHLRLPSQGDPLMPPNPQPFPPGPLGVPGSVNPMGPLGGPQVPSLVDDSIAKQYPRRFN